jgi:4-amino-4-deoxy-L-arabinose transferase-like glycosyltransferase
MFLLRKRMGRYKLKDELCSFIKKHPLGTISLIATILYIVWIWFPLGLVHSWNEAYYTMRVTYIVEGGSYLDGRFDNPPLFVYSLSFLSKIFGISVILFRFFIVFCTLVTTYIVYQIGYILGNKRVGLVSSALYAFFPMTVIFSKIIQIDMFAIMLMTASFYFAILGIKKDRRWFFLAGFFLGLTVFTKIPMALVIIPIFYYMFYRKIEIKCFLLLIIETILVPLPWIAYVWFVKPSFLRSGASSSSNFFGLGSMHSGVPYYQLTMILLAIIVLGLLIILIWKHKPTSVEEKNLAFYFLIFSVFFLVLPNHEYYLLPVFVPLFIFIGMIYTEETRWKKFKKIIFIFLGISIILLLARPIYDVNWEEAVNFIKENYTENVTIFSTSPKVTEYYFQHEVNWLHPDQITNISANNIIIMFTSYDRIDLENVHVMEIIEEKFMFLKSFNDKLFIYGSKNLA